MFGKLEQGHEVVAQMLNLIANRNFDRSRVIVQQEESEGWSPSPFTNYFSAATIREEDLAFWGIFWAY